ncbi:hypothetical protein DFH08DRAFT_933662 [Mycena albidolilacea]|uniref:Uncharacterized protein n=1 Tax=Mycena albidolilacea TaxID=1033008 RepID=A0AAD7EYG4_9AGAR|nr:hypothetical protein DFH08DRAFT_933662 [Mycena albidolilacea]
MGYCYDRELPDYCLYSLAFGHFSDDDVGMLSVTAVACANKTQDRLAQEKASLAEAYPHLAPLFALNDVPKVAQVAVAQEILSNRNATLSTLEAKISEIDSEFSRMYSVIKAMLAYRNTLHDEKRALCKEMRRSCLSYFISRPSYFHCYPYDFRIYRTSSTSDGMPIFGTLPKSEDLEWHRSEDEEEEFWIKVDEVVVPLESRMTYPPTIEIASYMQSSLCSIESYLQRSGEAPISARVVYRDSPHTMPLFNALWRRSHRLRHLALVDVPHRTRPIVSILRILQAVPQPCPRCSATTPPPPTSECPSFLTNPHLTSIYITTVTRTYVPWAQLSKYCENHCMWDNEDGRWASYRQLSNVIEFLRLRGSVSLSVNLHDILGASPDLPEIFIGIPSIPVIGLVAGLAPPRDHQPPLGSKLEVVRLQGDFRYSDDMDGNDVEIILEMLNSCSRLDSKTVSPIREFSLYSPQSDMAICQKLQEASLGLIGVRSWKEGDSDFLKGHLLVTVDNRDQAANVLRDTPPASVSLRVLWGLHLAKNRCGWDSQSVTPLRKPELPVKNPVLEEMDELS